MELAQKSQDPRKKFIDDLTKQMQQGTAPWQISRPAGFEMPFNPLDGSPYHPYNALKLLVAAHEKGYTDPRWMTYDEAQAMGAQVIERGAVMIEKWQRTERVPEVNPEDGEPVLDAEGKQKFVDKQLKEPRLVSNWLFNASQIENLPAYERSKPGYSQERLENMMRSAIQDGRARFEAGAQRAYYSPQYDTINLRAPNSYPSRQELHADALRGLGYWASSSTRLGYNSNEPVGTTMHAKDLIRTEIFCLIAASEYGLPHAPRSTSPAPENIIKALKNSPSDLRVLANEASIVMNSIGTFDKERQVQQARPAVTTERPQIIPRQRLMFVEQQLSPADEFKAFAKSMALELAEQPILDGSAQNIQSPDGKVIGTYQGVEGGPVNIQNTITGKSAQWVAKGYHLTPDQRSDMISAAKIAYNDRREELEARYRDAAEKTVQVLAAAIPLNPDSRVMPDFLRERDIKAHGLYVSQGETILVPAQDLQGKVWTCQAIDPDGKRSFPADTKTQGCVAMIGGTVDRLSKDPVVILAESYESAAVIHDVSKRPVAIAFSADNIRAVAQEIKAVNPKAEITVFSDRGTKIENDRRDKILGEAEKSIGLRVTLPPGGARTFNDVVKKFDLSTLKVLVETNTFQKEIKSSAKDVASKTRQLPAGMER